MLGFRGGLAFDLVDFGWFQAPRGGCDRYSGRFDINSTLIYLAAVRLDTILTFLLLISGSRSLQVADGRSLDVSFGSRTENGRETAS